MFYETRSILLKVLKIIVIAGKKNKNKNNPASLYKNKRLTLFVVTRHEKQSNIIICGLIKKLANVQIKTFSKTFSHSAQSTQFSILIFHKHIIPHENS